MNTVIHVDPHDADVENVVSHMLGTLRDAPDGSALSVDRDTMRAVLGHHRLLTEAVDALTAALRDAFGDDVAAAGRCLAEHGITLRGLS